MVLNFKEADAEKKLLKAEQLLEDWFLVANAETEQQWADRVMAYLTDRVSGDLAYADAVVSEADLLLAVLDPFIEALAAKPERTKDGREAQEIDIETGWAQIDKLRTAIADYRKRRPVR